MFRSCLGRTCHQKSPSPVRRSPPRTQKTLKTATNKNLLILRQHKNVPRTRKQLIERELARRNKNNYGYELAKMFGVKPPPTNKIRVAHGNVLGRIAKQSGIPMKQLRLSFAPEHAEHFTRAPKQNNPKAREYRVRRKIKRAGLYLTSVKNVKQLQSLQRANNYATGRSSIKPSNSTMRYYFRTHPRPAQMNAHTVNNIRRALRERIQENLFEYMSVPNRNNLRQKWEILTNRNQVNTLNNLVKKMRRYNRSARNTWEPHNAQTFANMYNRAITRNKYGFYYR